MKQSVVMVIAYLLERCRLRQKEVEDIFADQEMVKKRLANAGFSAETISQSLDWIYELIEQQKWYSAGSKEKKSDRRTIRIFDFAEKVRLGVTIQNFILYLENEGILDTKMREIVISQLLQLDQYRIKMSDAKWVVLLVLMSKFNRNVDEIRKYFLAATASRA